MCLKNYSVCILPKHCIPNPTNFNKTFIVKTKRILRSHETYLYIVFHSIPLSSLFIWILLNDNQTQKSGNNITTNNISIIFRYNTVCHILSPVSEQKS